MNEKMKLPVENPHQFGIHAHTLFDYIRYGRAVHMYLIPYYADMLILLIMTLVHMPMVDAFISKEDISAQPY